MTKALMKRLDEGKLYYSISEVCALTGLEQHVLRYWESEFPQLRPKKNRAGNRAYRGKEIKLVRYIKYLLYDEMYTIQGAKRKLAEASGSDLEGQINLLGPIPGVMAALPGNLNVTIRKRRSRLIDEENEPENVGLVSPLDEPHFQPTDDGLNSQEQSPSETQVTPPTLGAIPSKLSEQATLDIQKLHQDLSALLVLLKASK